MNLLLIGMLLSASDVGPAKQIEMLKVPSEIYWASYRASGAKLCDRTLRENQQRQFDKRFGARVTKLISAMAGNNYGTSQNSDLVVTSSCLGFRDREAGEAELSRALDDFGPILRKIERRHGIGSQ